MATTLDPLSPNEAPVETVPGASLKARLTDSLMAKRLPGQIVKVTQVSGHHFRVNWMSPATVTGDATVLRTYHMTKSQFVRVDEQNGELVVTDQTR